MTETKLRPHRKFNGTTPSTPPSPFNLLASVPLPKWRHWPFSPVVDIGQSKLVGNITAARKQEAECVICDTSYHSLSLAPYNCIITGLLFAWKWKQNHLLRRCICTTDRVRGSKTVILLHERYSVMNWLLCLQVTNFDWMWNSRPWLFHCDHISESMNYKTCHILAAQCMIIHYVKRFLLLEGNISEIRFFCFTLLVPWF